MLLTLLAAYASEVVHDPLPLDAVVRRSTVIAVVKPAGEAKRHTIHIPEAPKAPPFTYMTHPVAIERVVHDPDRRIAAGTTIEVGPGQLAIDYDMHVMREVDGVTVSPIIQVYTSPVAPDAPTWVAMLSPCTAGPATHLCPTVPGAMEKPASLDRIRAILAEHAKRSNGGPPTSQPREAHSAKP